MNRSAMREIAFQFLYGAEIQKELKIEQIELFLKNMETENDLLKEYVNNIVTGIIEHNDEIKNKIEENLKPDWQIERVSKVNLALLKLAIFEINFQGLPYKAIINEVVELAKKYGGDTSQQFINGVLASIVNQ